MRIVKEKSFYKNVFMIAVPIAMQNFITILTGLLDTMMLGKADETGVLLSASSLGGQPFFILSMFCFGLSGAGAVLSSQYWGKKDTASIKKVFALVFQISVVVSLFFSIAAIFFPRNIMQIYSGVPEVIDRGIEYLQIMGFAYVFFAISSTFICSLRSVELVKISVIANIISFFVNAGLNYLLIFGNFGFPKMGIAGAALATLIARLVEFTVTIIFVFFVDKRLNMRFRDLFTFDKRLTLDLLRHGTPVVINEVMWSVGMSVQAAILGHITYSAGDPVAANAIAGVVQQLTTVFVFGIANAAAVIIGKSIGQGDREKTILRAKTLKYMSFIVGALAFGAVLLVKDIAVDFYNVTAGTRELALQLIVVVAFVTFCVAVSSMFIVGILRGAGDTKFCLFAELACLWGVSVPFGLILAFVCQSPVPLVLIGMRLDEPLKAIICFIRSRGDRWIKDVTHY